MKKLFSFWLLVVLALLLTTACNSSSEKPIAQAAESEPETAQTTEEEAKVIPVEVAVTQTGPMSLILPFAGTIQPKDSLNVTPGAAGRVESVLVKVGDEVQAGDPIAVIEDDTYLVQLSQAQAAVTSAKLNLAKMELGSRPEEIAAAQAAVQLARAAVNDVATISDDERTKSVADLARAQAALKLAQTEYDKIAWAGDVGRTPQALALEQATITYQNSLAKYNLDTTPSDSQLAPLMMQQAQAELALALKLKPYRQIDLEAAKVGIKQAEAALELANIQLREVVIKAPFDGVIADLLISQGSRVKDTTPIVAFISKDLEVAVNVPESQVSQVKSGQNAAVKLTAYPGQDFPGLINTIAPTANKDSRTFEVTITPTQGADLLRSGMYADVSVLAEEKPSTLLAPRAAIFEVEKQPMVYVVKKDNTVEQRPVTTGLYDQTNMEILSGLEEGEAVVTAGQSNLTDGAKVEISNDPRVAE